MAGNIEVDGLLGFPYDSPGEMPGDRGLSVVFSNVGVAAKNFEQFAQR